MSKPLSPDAAATATTTVTGADLADVLCQTPDDAFPPVYATSKMIGLMELAAARAMRPLLAAGEVSVGVSIDVAHTAATPLGGQVTAEAVYVGQEGKLHLFEVIARDAAGEVGRGRHRRAVVVSARLLEGARKRTGA
jgi:fluoroacetyl-CoA thioesterase